MTRLVSVTTIHGWATVVAMAVVTLPIPSLAADLDLCEPTLAPWTTTRLVPDMEFAAVVSEPAFPEGEGPAVFLDEGHYNFHTAKGRYIAFVKLLRNDGFVVESLRSTFNSESLAPVDILVIANAASKENTLRPGGHGWKLPTPSAFTADEIDAVAEWVAEGGSLFLIADHMPFPGGSQNLASEFGILMTNGFATDAYCAADEYLFSKEDGTLADHPVTRGRNESERVTFVRSFTGQAFRTVSEVDGLLMLAPGSVILLPVESWKFSEETPRISGDGMLQGAVLAHGKGRVAVFGEAAMFSALVSGEDRFPMGMNSPDAEHNPQFVLNVMRWLAGALGGN